MEITINVHVTGLDKLADAITGLSKCSAHSAAAIIPDNTAGIPADVPAQASPDVPTNSAPAPVAPAAVPTYTVEDLGRAAAPLMDTPAGVQTLRDLLAQFGVTSLQQLPEDKYGSFATELRRLGANI